MIQNAESPAAALWRNYHRGRTNEKRNLLVEHYLPLVGQVVDAMAFRRSNKQMDKDSAMQEGCIGLMDAIEKYRPSRGLFPTYAFHRIKGAILDYLRRLLPSGRLLNQHKVEYEKERGIRTAQHGEEAALLMENKLWASDKGHAEKCMCAGKLRLRSLDAPVELRHTQSWKTVSYIDIVRDDHVVFADVDRDDWWSDLCKALPSHWALAIAARYKEGLNLKEIGDAVGFSESRISQVLSLHNVILRDFPQVESLATDNRITDRERKQIRKPSNENKFQLALVICS